MLKDKNKSHSNLSGMALCDLGWGTGRRENNDFGKLIDTKVTRAAALDAWSKEVDKIQGGTSITGGGTAIIRNFVSSLNSGFSSAGGNSNDDPDPQNGGKEGQNSTPRITVRFHYVYEDETPTIYSMTVSALAMHPEWGMLTYNGGGAARIANRKAALAKTRGIPPVAGFSWDEFPYAITVEGGKSAFIISAPQSEQQIQAGHLGALVTKGSMMRAGERIIVVPMPSSMTQPSPSVQPNPFLPLVPVILRQLFHVRVPALR